MFAALSGARGWSWWPFTLVVLAYSGIQLLYFNQIDFDWYRETHLMTGLADLAPADQRTIAAMMTPNRILLTSILGGLALLCALQGVIALYLHRLTQLDDENIHSFGDWFGLCWWLLLPTLVASIISLVWIVSSGSEIDPAALNPTSLNRLVGLASEHVGYALVESMDLLTLWSLAWLFLAIRSWTRLSRLVTGLITFTPAALLYGLWALLL
ncbi:hypothetical protein GCM10023333_03250 [Ferrimonas pelagia]|uniref:Yip1 domain-containing protein n=1 Tax=Ferrimonas pelagia TaxID=1177826 RepID=A0ABP9EDN7_9GAMM